MAEYIDRKAVIENLDILMNKSELGYVIGQAVKRYIKRQPSADVAPVRHGRWVSLTKCANEGVYCSICEKKVWKSDYALCSQKSRNKLRSNYCPNCGAKMDTEVQE